jgi:hypothetical protein
MIDFDKRALDYKLYFRNFCCMHDAPFKVEDLHADPELSGRDQDAAIFVSAAFKVMEINEQLRRY